MKKFYLFLAVNFFASAMLSHAAILPGVTLDGEAGTGTLTHTVGETKESVAFGPKSGHYVLAFAVETKLLPATYRKDFVGDWVMQVAMGNLKGTNPNDLPQFGSATLILASHPTMKASINLRIPDAREKTVKNTGYILFTPPSTPAERPSEDKLKGTYFGSLGTAILVPQGEKRKVSLDANGKSLPFFEQKIRADLNTEMTTPFNPSISHLGGSVEFPVYWPASKASETFARDIVQQAFGPTRDTASDKKPLK
jgi:hypothetical protein